MSRLLDRETHFREGTTLDEQPETAGQPHRTPWFLGLQHPVDGDSIAQAEAHPNPNSTSSTGLPPDTLGVAFSGGGIRSASFCLGVLQVMARAGWLRHVDYLSTVSGGSYVGTFLGRFFDSFRGRRAEPDYEPGAVQGRVARELANPTSTPIAWLRHHSNYLAPGGSGDAAVNFAGFLRNLLSIYLVLGTFILAVFGVFDLLEYSQFKGTLGSVSADLIGILTPLTSLLPMDWAGPWLFAAEAALWLGALPLMASYWLVSQDLPEGFTAPVLVAAAILAVALLVVTASPLPLLVLAASVFWSLGAWRRTREEEGPEDPTHPYRLMLPREHLTRRLALVLAATLGLSAFGVIDRIGAWLARLMLEGGLTVPNVAGWLVSIGTTGFIASSALRTGVRWLAMRSTETEVLKRVGHQVLWTIVALVLGAGPPLIVLSFLSHAAFESGQAYLQGAIVTALALVLSLLFGSRGCLSFVNRSGPLGIYAGRLARTFLGAVNPERRQHPVGRDVTRSFAGDDAPLSEYRPDLASGPLHVINCAVNETVDVSSTRVVRDRQAENLAVGPAGISVSKDWHALWVHGEGNGAMRPGSLMSLRKTGPDPFLGEAGGPVSAEPLHVREWVSISGAAVSPGMGRRTETARSLLLTLANARLGYWWDSGLEANDRADLPTPRRGLLTRLGRWIARPFRTQWLLLQELTGRFAGPWSRYWYLSDGGFFEVTGAYELLRRRVPFIILCDAGEDPDHRGADLARLVRLAQVDLGAEIDDVDPNADPESLRQAGVPEEVLGQLGALSDLLPSSGERPARHAALLRVTYPGLPDGVRSDGDPWLARQHSWVLYIKATYTGDEPADVRSYAASNHDFPNESTLDQIFDEAQWESYRRLGEHIGVGLFTTSRSPTT